MASYKRDVCTRKPSSCFLAQPLPSHHTTLYTHLK